MLNVIGHLHDDFRTVVFEMSDKMVVFCLCVLASNGAWLSCLYERSVVLVYSSSHLFFVLCSRKSSQHHWQYNSCGVIFDTDIVLQMCSD